MLLTSGAAMKSTKSGQKWAHVSCALWIPEVSIGCVNKMEPITKIPSIPVSIWHRSMNVQPIYAHRCVQHLLSERLRLSA